MLDQGAMMSSIYNFLCAAEPNHSGFLIHNIWGFSLVQLEENHDYIQWLFPLPTASECVPNSPVLTAADIVMIKSSTVCADAIRKSTLMMLNFYGATNHWARSSNHNMRRISRMIQSSNILLGKSDSKCIYDCITKRCKELKFIPDVKVVTHWQNGLEHLQYKTQI